MTDLQLIDNGPSYAQWLARDHRGDIDGPLIPEIMSKVGWSFCGGAALHKTLMLGNEPVGMFMALPFVFDGAMTKRARPSGYNLTWAIRGAFQGKGLARPMVLACLQELQAGSPGEDLLLNVQTRKENQPSVRLAQSLGLDRADAGDFCVAGDGCAIEFVAFRGYCQHVVDTHCERETVQVCEMASR